MGKTASLAAMALTFAAFAVPDDWQRPVAVVAVLSIGGVNYRGITRTAQLTRVIVSVVLAALAVGVTVSLLGSDPSLARLTTGSDEVTLRGVLQSAAVLFFAFAGYARIAPLAEEVRDPEGTIPRAVTVALSLAVLLYALVGAPC